MDFSSWLVLNEGFSVDLSKVSHEEIVAAMGNEDKRGLRNILTTGQIRYSPNDSPNDLLKLVPMQNARELSYIIPDHPLPTFKKVKIYYGFEFPSVFAFGDDHMIQPLQQPLNDKGRGLKPKIKPDWRGDKWWGDDEHPDDRYWDARTINSPEWRVYQELELYVAELGKGNVQPFMMRLRVRELVHPIEPPLQPPQVPQQQSYDNSYYSHPITHKPFNLSPDLQIARKQGQQLLVKLQKEVDQAQGRYARLLDKHGYASDKINTSEQGNKYYHALKIVLVKMLKEPPTEASQSVQQEFMDAAIQHFVRQSGVKRYNVITYPQSSKSFNQIFAARMASQLKIKKIQMFNKLPAEEVTLDTQRLKQRYKNNPQSYDNKQAYLNAILQQKQGHNTMKIASVVDKAHRKYIRQFDTQSGSFANQHVLIIDDNVDAGGTFEVLYDMVIKQKPASIDLYSPLYMGDHHHN